jgi:ribosomal protein L37AE/L43A
MTPGVVPHCAGRVAVAHDRTPMVKTESGWRCEVCGERQVDGAAYTAGVEVGERRTCPACGAAALEPFGGQPDLACSACGWNGPDDLPMSPETQAAVESMLRQTYDALVQQAQREAGSDDSRGAR